jgi:uncharacterized membrane protein
LRLFAALCAAGLGAWGARRQGALTAGGAWAAWAVGAAVFGAAPWRAALALVAFFVTATLLGRLPGRPRHGPRTERQVLANGGVAALAALAGAAGAPWARAALVGALAAACGDTWATEAGRRWGGRPRRLGLGPAVAEGESGGMTALGTLAGAAGAALVAAVGGGGAAALAGGVAGILADSLLGAALQVSYRCPACGARAEGRGELPCACTVAPRRRGLPFLDNDAVNLLATATGAAVACALRAAAPG